MGPRLFFFDLLFIYFLPELSLCYFVRVVLRYLWQRTSLRSGAQTYSGGFLLQSTGSSHSDFRKVTVALQVVI